MESCIDKHLCRRTRSEAAFFVRSNHLNIFILISTKQYVMNEVVYKENIKYQEVCIDRFLWRSDICFSLSKTPK